MDRCFFITYRTFQGEVGGGRGVIYRLFLANRKYNLFPNSYYCFTDTCLSSTDNPPVHQGSVEKGDNSGTRFSSIKKFLRRIGLYHILRHQIYVKAVRQFLESLNDKYHFDSTDCFVFHDIESSGEFVKLYHFTNTVLVYHQQGNLYYEQTAMGMPESVSYHKYLNKYVANTMNRTEKVCFPSIGAKECFFSSDSEMEKLVSKKEFDILYNGFAKPDALPPSQDETVNTTLNTIDALKGLKLITVANLNEAKGVERIPTLLGELKKKMDFKWILIGNGAKREEVDNEIHRAEIEDNTIWIKNSIAHNDILRLFEKTDVYILMHRFSIFDYATLEAMAYYNIPILSDVGGNREVIIDNNGLLVTDVTDAQQIINYLMTADIEKTKEKNAEVYEKHFNDKVFLAGYEKEIGLLTRN